MGPSPKSSPWLSEPHLRRTEFEFFPHARQAVTIVVGFCIETVLTHNHGVFSLTVTANPGVEVAKDQLDVVPFYLLQVGCKGLVEFVLLVTWCPLCRSVDDHNGKLGVNIAY